MADSDEITVGEQPPTCLIQLRALAQADSDSEFRYDREPIGTLQGLAPDRVALLGSVSKSLAPALAPRLDRLPAATRWSARSAPTPPASS